eukprot:117038-Chlamydomonas_euryale.AAC.1
MDQPAKCAAHSVVDGVNFQKSSAPHTVPCPCPSAPHHPMPIPERPTPSHGHSRAPHTTPCPATGAHA